MKHLIKFRMAMAAALMCLPILFASCSKEEENNNNNNNNNPEPEALVLAFDPLLEWGCSLADVERHIQSKEWWQDGNSQLEYWEDPFESWHKWYYVDSANMLTEQYLFETEEGQNLRYVICICWNNTVPAEKFVSTLYHQGFHFTGEMVGFDGDIFERYLSADGETEALYNTDAEGYSQALYRPMEKSQPVTEFPYSQGFEDGLDGWTIIDANNDGIAWMVEPNSSYVPAHSGEHFAMSFSWMEGGLQADEYLVSPEIVLPAGQTATLSWWFRVNPEYPEDTFAVMLGNDSGLTTLIDITPTAEQGEWTQQTLDLSAYAGQSIWLGFHHHSYDHNYIAIDDILITTGDNTAKAIASKSVPSSTIGAGVRSAEHVKAGIRPAKKVVVVK